GLLPWRPATFLGWSCPLSTSTSSGAAFDNPPYHSNHGVPSPPMVTTGTLRTPAHPKAGSRVPTLTPSSRIAPFSVPRSAASCCLNDVRSSAESGFPIRSTLILPCRLPSRLSQYTSSVSGSNTSTSSSTTETDPAGRPRAAITTDRLGPSNRWTYSADRMKPSSRGSSIDVSLLNNNNGIESDWIPSR